MVESVDSQFLHKELTPLPAQVKPTCATLKKLKKELVSNAMSVPSVRGGGGHGHLALLLTDAACATVSGGVPFVAPVHPGAAPHHAAGATQAQITETNRQHAADLDEFKVYKTVEGILKRQIIEAVPETFINEVSDEVYAHANVTPRALLEHLETTYGVVTHAELEQNLEDLRQWTSAQPIEDLFQQIRRCRAFAANHDPITELTAMRSGVNNLENSGVFTVAIQDWHKRPEAEKTLANFFTHFRNAPKGTV